MVRKNDIIRLAKAHKDCGFMIFTNGTLVDQEFCDGMREAANIVLSMSIEGDEESTRIRSDADRQKAIILAEAARDGQVIRGDADAKAAATYAAAYGKNPDFYAFQRWLEAMKNSFSKNSKMVLSSPAPLIERQK